MVKIPDGIAPPIDRFISIIRQKWRMDAVYLYGSFARGNPTKWSDIDLALVSPDFTSDRFQEQVNLMRIAVTIDNRIEPRPFRPEDFNETDPLASEILRKGVRIL